MQEQKDEDVIKAKPWESDDGWPFLDVSTHFKFYSMKVKRAIIAAQDKYYAEKEKEDNGKWNEAMRQYVFGDRYNERCEYEGSLKQYIGLPWWRRKFARRPIWSYALDNLIIME